jgi:hypothetical protein
MVILGGFRPYLLYYPEFCWQPPKPLFSCFAKNTMVSFTVFLLKKSHITIKRVRLCVRIFSRSKDLYLFAFFFFLHLSGTILACHVCTYPCVRSRSHISGRGEDIVLRTFKQGKKEEEGRGKKKIKGVARNILQKMRLVAKIATAHTLPYFSTSCESKGQAKHAAKKAEEEPFPLRTVGTLHFRLISPARTMWLH